MKSLEIMEALTDMDDEVLLLAEADPPKRRRLLPRAFRYATAACLAAVLTMTAWLAIDSIAAEARLRWTVRYREYGVTWLFKDGADFGGELPNYQPTLLPEGYVLDWEYWGADRSRSMTYRSTDGGAYICLGYTQITNRGTHHFYDLPEGSYERETVEINGMPGELYIYVDDRARGKLVWIDEDDCIVFTLGFENNDPTEALRIAESVVLVE